MVKYLKTKLTPMTDLKKNTEMHGITKEVNK